MNTSLIRRFPTRSGAPGAKRAALLLAIACVLPTLQAGEALSPPPYGQGEITARQKTLEAAGARGDRLVGYLDCGIATESTGATGCALRQLDGSARLAAAPGGALIPGQRTFASASGQLRFEAAGLDPKKTYALGFSWWDAGAGGGRESVEIEGGSPSKSQLLMPPTRLPELAGAALESGAWRLPLPAALASEGRVRVTFKREDAADALACELWLWEIATEDAVPERARRPAAVRVLIATGNEYPGHHWRETAPKVAELLGADPRLQVSVVEQIEYVGTPAVFGFDVIFLNYMNWESPSPGAPVLENLRRFVAGGRGLVLLHFACGAFQDWPEFRRLAGRVYDPKLPPHDPRGPFKVSLTSLAHPITRGLQPFDTDDELYTCLAGDQPIQVLATARSKLDGKEHPMAFVLDYGSGRVFHSPLGHDVKALSFPEVGELYRRGTAWAAGL